MEFMSATMRPGTVRQVLENGNIKVSAPGLFSSQDEPDLLPPVMYLSIGGPSNQFSKPEELDEVWVIQNNDNPQQLYWFRKDRQYDINKDLGIDPECEDVEILCTRPSGMGYATIYFTDGTGWIIQNGEASMVIRPNGDIVMSTGASKRTISITGAGISLGADGPAKYSAVLGEELVDFLNALLKLLGQTGQAALANPYTATLGAALMPKIPVLAQKVSGMLSGNVTLE